MVAAGLAAGQSPSEVFVVEGSEAADAAANDPALAGLRVLTLTRRVAEKLTTLQTAPDVMGVFALPSAPPLESLASPAAVVVYADRIADPGNMGTLIRAAAAFAAAALVASPGCVDLFSPKVVRASMGAVFSLPLYPDTALGEVTRALGQAQVYGLVAHGGEPLPRAALSRPAVVCVGSERAGIEPPVLRQVARRLTIPLAPGGRGGVESLNAGVAGAVALYEFSRRAGDVVGHTPVAERPDGAVTEEHTSEEHT